MSDLKLRRNGGGTLNSRGIEPATIDAEIERPLDVGFDPIAYDDRRCLGERLRHFRTAFEEPHIGLREAAEFGDADETDVGSELRILDPLRLHRMDAIRDDPDLAVAAKVIADLDRVVDEDHGFRKRFKVRRTRLHGIGLDPMELEGLAESFYLQKLLRGLRLFEELPECPVFSLVGFEQVVEVGFDPEALHREIERHFFRFAEIE